MFHYNQEFWAIQLIADKVMIRWYRELCELSKAFDLRFSTCPGSWPSSSPQMLSCLLCGLPADKNTNTKIITRLSASESTPLIQSQMGSFTHQSKGGVEQTLFQTISLSQSQLISCNQTEEQVRQHRNLFGLAGLKTFNSLNSFHTPALTASLAIAETSLELEAIFSPHLTASDTSWSTG